MKYSSLLFILLACAADARSPDPRDPAAPPSQPGQPGQMHGVTLTAGAPRQDLAITAPGTAPSALTLTIATIENPSSQAFSLSASVMWSNAGAAAIEETIGRATPYPATQPGSFMLAVPEAVRRTLSRSYGQLVLRLSLQPIAADRPLSDPLRVTLGDPAWR